MYLGFRQKWTPPRVCAGIRTHRRPWAKFSLCPWLSASLLLPFLSAPWGASSGTARNHGFASDCPVPPCSLLFMVWVEEQLLGLPGDGDGQGGRTLTLLGPPCGVEASLGNSSWSFDR